MRKNFELVRDALEEHLRAINENSVEIQSLFDYLHEMDVKIEKISQRLDHVQLTAAVKHVVEPLSSKEKEIFRLFQAEETPLSYPEIAERLLLTESCVRESVIALMSKGIPLLRTVVNNQMFLKLVPGYRGGQLVHASLHSFLEK
jgi:DNA-directed RNA polymerase specialized sigma subunit